MVCMALLVPILILEILVPRMPRALAKGPSEHSVNEEASWQKGLTTAVLLAIGLSPAVVMYFAGVLRGEFLLAMLLMHWLVMLVLPAAYLTGRHCVAAMRGQSVDPWGFYGQVFDAEMSGLLKRLLWGTLFGVCAVVVGLPTFALATCRVSRPFLDVPFCVRSMESHMRDYGVTGLTLPPQIAIGAYFCLVNPVFEELFWRVFLHRELGSVALPPPGGYDERQPDRLVSPAGKWLISALYASYHIFPIAALTGFASRSYVYAAGGFASLVALGRMLTVLRETPGFGVAAAVVAHVGVDIVVVLFLGLFVLDVI